MKKHGWIAMGLMMISLTAMADKAQRDYSAKTLMPAIEAAKAKFKESCGCPVSIVSDDKTIVTVDDMSQARYMAETVTAGAPKYCTDAPSKKAVCQLKTLTLAKSKKVEFTFNAGAGVMTTDGQGHAGWTISRTRSTSSAGQEPRAVERMVMKLRCMPQVAIGIGLLGLVAAPSRAHADVFVFKDLAGFEKCMSLNHLAETEKTDKGEQTRWLSQSEIQQRCVDAGVKVVAAAKNRDLATSFVSSAKRLGSPRLALDLVGALVEISLSACNEMSNYEILMGPLEDRDDASVDLQKTRPHIKRCLKDPQFAKDFMDEKDNQDPHHAAHACQILAEEKLVKSCKGPSEAEGHRGGGGAHHGRAVRARRQDHAVRGRQGVQGRRRCGRADGRDQRRQGDARAHEEHGRHHRGQDPAVPVRGSRPRDQERVINVKQGSKTHRSTLCTATDGQWQCYVPGKPSDTLHLGYSEDLSGKTKVDELFAAYKP